MAADGLLGRWRARRPHAAPEGTTLAALLVAVPAVVLVVVARYTSLELTGGRCRARNKTDGQRCSLHRPPNRDLCHVHERTHDVELVPEAERGGLEARADGST